MILALLIAAAAPASAAAAPPAAGHPQEEHLPRRAQRAVDRWIQCFAGGIASASLGSDDAPEAGVERALAGCSADEAAMRTALAGTLPAERATSLANDLRAMLTERGRADIAAFRPAAVPAAQSE